jgi:hypothetical protein
LQQARHCAFSPQRRKFHPTLFEFAPNGERLLILAARLLIVPYPERAFGEIDQRYPGACTVANFLYQIQCLQLIAARHIQPILHPHADPKIDENACLPIGIAHQTLEWQGAFQEFRGAHRMELTIGDAG